jgi:uncharacterized protein (TIGR00251 family)
LSAGGARAQIKLRIVPNARRTEVVGEYGEAIKIKIHAPAIEGKANAALLDFLAERLHVAAGGVELIAGEKSRDKTVEVSGLSEEEVRKRLSAT